MGDNQLSVPADLGLRGRGFWLDVHATYELSTAERELLAEACRVLDLLEVLRDVVEQDG